MDKRLMHYQFPRDQIQLVGTMAELPGKVAAVVEDTTDAATDAAIVAAILAAARAEGVTDLYLLDKTFILDAIREKKEREKPKSLTIEELQRMDGEPVWVTELGAWAIVVVDDGGNFGGMWKGVPFVHTNLHGIDIEWNAVTRNLKCYRHRPKEEPHGK